MLTHRPHGIEHPYATSPDQRIPVQPLAGQQVHLGVVVSPDVTRVVCEWGDVELTLTPAEANAADAAALAGGEGHLAEAQATALGGDGGWSVVTPPLTDPIKYRFHAYGEAAAGSAGPAGPGIGGGASASPTTPARWRARSGLRSRPRPGVRTVECWWVVGIGWVGLSG